MDLAHFVASRTTRHLCALTLLACTAVPGIAHAHVTVTPREAAAKSSPQLTIRVPSEKDVPTESVRLEFPPGLQVLRLKPMPGWTSEIERDDSGKIIAITYKGGKIGREEYQEFSLIARMPEQTGPIRIKAYQNYAGGVQVAWINDAEPQPAPTLNVTPAVAAAAAAPADPFAAPTVAPALAPPPPASAPAPGGSSTAVWLSGLSLVLSAVAVAAALRPGRRGAA